MAEPTTPAGAEPADPKPDPKAEPEPQGDDTDWKAEARKWETRAKASRDEAKANAEAAKRLKEMEDADKSEVDKAKEDAAAATRRAEEAEARALRLEIGHEKGLTPGQVKRLVGSSREELEADADELLADFAASKTTSTSRTGKPAENLRPGASADETPEPSGKEIAERILAEDRN